MRIAQVVMLLVLLFGSELAHTQAVPGYMGKRFAFGYSAVMMPGMSNLPGVNTPYVPNRQGGSLIFNFQHRFTSEYVVAKKWSLTGEIIYSNVAFGMNHESGFDPSMYSDDWVYGSALGFMLGTRQYRKHLAPLSRFLGYKVGYYHVRTDPHTVYNRSVESSFPYSEVTFPGIQTGTAVLGFSVGTNRVIQDKAMITFGFDISFLVRGRQYGNSIVGLNSQSVDFNYDRPNSQTNVEILENFALGRVYAESFFNFSIGLSFLP